MIYCVLSSFSEYILPRSTSELTWRPRQRHFANVNKHPLDLIPRLSIQRPSLANQARHQYVNLNFAPSALVPVPCDDVAGSFSRICKNFTFGRAAG